MSADQRLADLGIALPSPPMPVASYVPFKLHGGLLYLSGMIPVQDGQPLATGHLGGSVSLETGVECARLCTLNALAWCRQALGSLALISGVIRVRGFVACTPHFAEHPKVLNGCSDLLVEVFGEVGRHTRAAVGAPSLPLNVPVEIDFIFAVER